MPRRERSDGKTVHVDAFDDAVEELHEKLRKRKLGSSSDVRWTIASTEWRNHLEEAAREFLADLGIGIDDAPGRDRVG